MLVVVLLFHFGDGYLRAAFPPVVLTLCSLLNKKRDMHVLKNVTRHYVAGGAEAPSTRVGLPWMKCRPPMSQGGE